jgi:pyruvate dehydrogenase E2 component (dihydrolipoamide acetyltransferase)
MSDILLPSLGADMEAATLVEWKIKPGDKVTKGDIIADVETDKGTIEVEIFQTGTITALLIEPDTRVPVGTPIATIDAEGEAVTQAPSPAPSPPPPEAEKPSAPSTAQNVQAPSAGAPASPTAQPTPSVRAVPAAKRLAQELRIDLASIQGTGEGGAITKADVERAAAAAQGGGGVEAKADRGEAMRRAIAAAMTVSNREIPHYYLSDSVDMTNALARLAELNAEKPLAERILSNVLVIRAVAIAAREFPELNGFWHEGRFEAAPQVNLGVAISLRQGGLVTPAIHKADELSLAELMANLRDIITRVRSGSGSLRSSEVTETTLTLTNLGDLGVESVYGVIYPPQVALVGAGSIVDRPWAIDGRIEIRKVCQLTLAADHRASDGLRGAKFLSAVKRRLEVDLEDLFQ